MKVQTAFRLDKDLIEALKERAKAQNRSLSNYIEYVLYKLVGNIPNEETIKAIEDVHSKTDLEDIENLDEFLEKL